jgi:hypothetical protein
MGRVGPDTGATQSNHVFITLVQVLNPPFEFPYIRVDQAFLLPQVLLMRFSISRLIEVLVTKVRHIRYAMRVNSSAISVYSVPLSVAIVNGSGHEIPEAGMKDLPPFSGWDDSRSMVTASLRGGQHATIHPILLSFEG